MDVDIKADQLWVVMNLIECELHAHGSFITTKKVMWLDLKNKCRKLRTKYMAEIERATEDQQHCFNKHILSASFRLMEVGDKHLSSGDEEKARDCYSDSGELLEIFINMNWVEKT